MFTSRATQSTITWWFSKYFMNPSSSNPSNNQSSHNNFETQQLQIINEPFANSGSGGYNIGDRFNNSTTTITSSASQRFIRSSNPVSQANTPPPTPPPTIISNYFQPIHQSPTSTEQRNQQELPTFPTSPQQHQQQLVLVTTTSTAGNAANIQAVTVAAAVPPSEELSTPDSESGFSKSTTKKIKWAVAIILSVFASIVGIYQLAKRTYLD